MRRSRSSFALALAVALLLVCSARADGPLTPRFPTGHVSAADLQAFLAEVKVIPDTRCAPGPLHQLICDSSTQRTMWVFTLEGHPALPAVSRGVMVITPTASGTSVGIDRSGHYAGDKDAYLHWMQEFAELDRRQVKQWSLALKR